MKHAALKEHLQSIAELLRDNDQQARKIAEQDTVHGALVKQLQNASETNAALKGALAAAKGETAEVAVRLAEAVRLTPGDNERTAELIERCLTVVQIHMAVDLGPASPEETAVGAVDENGRAIF